MSLTIDVPDTWPDTLIQAGLLDRQLEDDRNAVRAATERFIASAQPSYLFEKQ